MPKPNGITQTHLIQANIGQDYWEVDFSNITVPEGPRKKTIQYLKKVAEMKEEGIGILYAGPNGPGKTTLAMIAMKYLARANWDVYTTSLGEIVEDIQRGFKSNSATDDVEGLEARARASDFLLIDDVGKEHRGGSGFVTTVFDNLIRHRVQHRLPTFITTNYTKSELRGTYGESAMSLLEGKLLQVTVDGDDFRRTNLKKALKERLR